MIPIMVYRFAFVIPYCNFNYLINLIKLKITRNYFFTCRFLSADAVEGISRQVWEKWTGVTRSELDFISRVLRDRLRCQLPEKCGLQGVRVQRGHWKLHFCGQSDCHTEKRHKLLCSNKGWRFVLNILIATFNSLIQILLYYIYAR